MTRPGDWCVATAMLLGLIGPLVAGLREQSVSVSLRMAAAVGAGVPLVFGVIAAFPAPRSGASDGISPAEAHALIERDFSWWLARQAPEPGAITLAPPELTAALIYHGGLRGLGSPYRENEGGFRFSVRLAGASTPDEGEALARTRNVRYVIIPSWDSFLDQYARLGANQTEHSIIALLHRWLPPRWLRPVPYVVPRVEGLVDASIAVFEVVDVQDNATALGRLAEYFIETGRMPQAVRLAGVLREQFPAELSALIARAQVAWVRRDAGEFREIMDELTRLIEEGGSEGLAWDRRVSLALALASARQHELARVEAQRCFDEMEPSLPRTLTERNLQQYLALLTTLGLEISDPELRKTVDALLPRESEAP